MAIYQPYFYIIQNTHNGMYYVGAKWSKDANPSNFMVEGGYITSSNIVKQLVKKHGLHVFIVRKIKTFETGEEAYRYETRFLRKVNARKNPKLYNGHNNDMGTMDHDKMKIMMLELYEVEHYSKTKEFKEKIRQTSQEKYGVSHPLQSVEIRDKGKKTNLDRYGFDHPMKSEAVRNKGIQTNLDRYGVKNYSETQEYHEKVRQSTMEKYGVEYHAQLPEQRKIVSERAKKVEKQRREKRQVKILRKYIEKYGSKNVGCGRAWFRKSDEYLDKLLEDAISKYGPL